MKRPWTPEEDGTLRRGYRRHTAAELAARLPGRTIQAVKCRITKLGLESGRSGPGLLWSAAELATLRAEYGRTPAPELAARLGRPLTRVYRKAAELGLAEDYARPPDAGQRAEVVRLVRLGWTDPQVAEHLDLKDYQVRRVRRRAGLPSNRWGKKHRARATEARRQTFAELGIGHLGELRPLVYRVRKAALGWPPDLSMPAVKILECLRAAGRPLTRLEIAAAIGVRPHSLDAGGGMPGHLGTLLARGLVTRAGRATPAHPRDRCSLLYALAPGVRPGPELVAAAMGVERRESATPKCNKPFIPRVYSTMGGDHAGR